MWVSHAASEISTSFWKGATLAAAFFKKPRIVGFMCLK
jgi:hypothetical protein